MPLSAKVLRSPTVVMLTSWHILAISAASVTRYSCLQRRSSFYKVPQFLHNALRDWRRTFPSVLSIPARFLSLLRFLSRWCPHDWVDVWTPN